MKYFHVQLTESSPITVEIGYSITHVMAWLTGDYTAMPYMWFTSEY